MVARSLIVVAGGMLIALGLSLGAIADEAGFSWRKPEWMPAPPVPEDNPMSQAKFELGRHLFYDARLSRDATMACVSCHVQSRGFSDGRETSVGVTGTLGTKNAPGLANVGYVPQLTWSNPHAKSLEFQSLFPLFGEAPEEMAGAGQEETIFARLADDPYYPEAFARAFPDRPQIDLFTLTRALAAFQRNLIALNSPYDRYKYGGDESAMSQAALRGEELFFDHRFECYHCHQGINFTDNMQMESSPWKELGYHNTGLYERYPAHSPGLIEITGRPKDAGLFRTPSLRNVAVTAPYMHDGSVADLRAVLEHYAAGGRSLEDGLHAGQGHKNPNRDPMIRGFDITEAETRDLIAFLESLTDTDFLNDPALSDPWPEDHPARRDRVMP